MVELKEMIRHPSHMLDKSARVAKPIGIGGLVVVALVFLGLYWMGPEIRRYLKIERM